MADRSWRGLSLAAAAPGRLVCLSRTYPNGRDRRVIADVVRLDKGRTECLEPRVTEELIKLMVSAAGGKVRALSSAPAQAG